MPTDEELAEREKRRQATSLRIQNMLRRRDETRVSKGDEEFWFLVSHSLFFPPFQIAEWQARLNQLNKLQQRCQGEF